VYRVTLDERTQEQIDALPPEGSAAWRQVHDTFEVAPWNGEPLYPDNPEGMLTWQFGPHREGLAYYLVVEHDQQVAVLEVQWFG
jgi:hypothetical protein